MSRILLVEDSKVQAFVALRLLRDAGYTVEHAETVESAVRSCYEEPPDLVLLDQHLADVSGLEVCRRLKNDIALTDVPVLVLTASNKDRDHIASLDAGADAFLPKDGPAHELLAVMSRLLESANGRGMAEANDRRGKGSVSGRTRVLVVDDSPTFRDVMRKKLVDAGFETTVAASGAEGLSLLEQQQFDVVAVDVVMPEMNGFEFCKKARQWSLERNVQLGLLVLTGSDREDVLVEALEAGADDHVGKLQEFDVILAHTTALARRIARAKHFESVNRRVAEQDAAGQPDRNKSDALTDVRDQIRDPVKTIITTTEHLLNSDLSDDQRDKLGSVKQSADAILALFADKENNPGIEQTEDPSEPDEEIPCEQDFDADVISLEAAERRVPGGSEGVRMVAEMLLVECPKMMQEIRGAVENGDAPLLHRSAHTLKGSATVFDAHGVVKAAYVIEKMGENGELTDVESRLSELESEVDKLTKALERLVAGQ